MEKAEKKEFEHQTELTALKLELSIAQQQRDEAVEAVESAAKYTSEIAELHNDHSSRQEEEISMLRAALNERTEQFEAVNSNYIKLIKKETQLNIEVAKNKSVSPSYRSSTS